MLQLTLLPALVAPTFAPAFAPLPCLPATFAASTTTLCAAELSRALPDEALGVLLVGDLEALLFADDVGQWARFLRDERWLGVFATFAESEGEDPEEVQQVLGLAQTLCRGIRGGAFAAIESESELCGVMRVDEGWFDGVRARVKELGDDLAETTCLGRPAITAREEDGSAAFLLVHDGTHAFLAIEPDLEIATATIGKLLAALEAAGEDTSERWWLASDARVADASIELFVNLPATMPADDLEEMTAMVGAPGIVYGGIVLGEGREAEAVMSFDIDSGPVMESIVNSLLTADPALLSYVPDGYTGTVIGLDVLAAIEEGLAFAEETTPGASTDYDQGLEELGSMLGVDLETDLLGHLTGQILMLQPNDYAEGLAELNEESTALETFLPVLALQIADVDAVLGVLAALAEAAATQGLEAEKAEIAGGSLWTFDPGLGTKIALAGGSGFLVIGAEQGTVDLLARAAKPSEERALGKELAALTKGLDGSVVTAAPMSTLIESLDSLEELMAMIGAEDEESALAAEVLSAVSAIAGEHLSGVMAAEMHLTSKRMSYRMLSR